ncbi:ABC transporter ATP-binding protein [Gracilibacillus kekensis]|uniref:Putative ABC transport system ATP-binding protein/putative ABC transport system ATP-binding protein n=1 Tax=Gracilibacillus kekensis TaxID=1027249 RepID=A0A1M7QDM9_9BACI|nr:ABC transporter ATP-binding protein [Gracilibacillus kekensis]SHN28682.1 putative ABC transport system ATP-binding protein/putative ABC transport system ATP-binding protein [Gracilibacillus kekensis]
MSLLQATNISKVYGSKRGIEHKAIDNISLSIEKGEFVGVMGPSGSGKTTLLNMLSTIDRLSAGTLTINGEEITRLPKGKLAKFRRREMGFIFQDFNLLDTLTIAENIMLPLTLDGWKVKDMENKLAHVANQLSIDTILRNRSFEVSGGQMQRAAIARAIIHEPAIIFADEPTGNLDSKASRQVMEALAHLNREKEATTLMVSHDPFAASFCERILFIKDGKIFNQLNKGDNRQTFFQEILNVQSMLGGDNDDLQTVRV